MAASDHHPHLSRLQPTDVDCFTSDELRERLEEEVSRAERHGTQLSCLLVVIENLGEMTREHGEELREQTLDYVAGALRRELRRFDRIGRAGRDGHEVASDLLIILPGADSPRAEIVARRTLERLRTIKVEARGTRSPLRVSVGLAAWRADVSAQTLLEQARAAVGRVGGEEEAGTPDGGLVPAPQEGQAAGERGRGSTPPVVGPAGRS
jgi:diguanylate cyclase (GGDEF)-like protein